MGRGFSLNLELPARFSPDDLERLLNERLRRIAGLVGATSTGAGGQTSTSAASLMLTVPGTLSVRSSAAPLVKLASSRTVTKLVALVKQAPGGAGIVLRLLAGGAEIASATVADGATSGEASVSGTIPAETLVTLDITSVGSVFPGADLTVLARFG